MAHNRGSFFPKCRGLRSIHASSPIRLRFVGWRAAKMHRSLWRTNWGAVSSAPFRTFGLPKFLAKIFGRHQEPDDGGANDGLGTDLLPGKAQVIMGYVPHR